MNPILITGALAVAAASAGMMASFSADHAEYARAVERASAMQSDRLREQLSVEAGPDGGVSVFNSGTVPVTILEVRSIGPDGRVAWSEPVSVRVGPGRSAEVIP